MAVATGDETLGSDDALAMLEELREARNHSYDIGLKLELGRPAVNAIHLAYLKPEDRLRNVLIEFMNQTDPRPTWRVIIDALRSPEVNLPHLAEKVEAAHFPGPTSTRDVSETAPTATQYMDIAVASCDVNTSQKRSVQTTTTSLPPQLTFNIMSSQYVKSEIPPSTAPVQTTTTSLPPQLTSNFDAIAEMTVQITNKEQHIVWEGYGLRLHIPPNSLPKGRSHFQLKISVALSGHFKLPEDGYLVSAVYSFSHNLGDRVLQQPVTVEMQHCCNTSVLKDLRIVKAGESSDSISAYEFKLLPGGTFDSDNGYGAIKMRHFCSISTFLLWRFLSLFSTMTYCAKLYYTKIEPHQFHFHLYVIPNLDMISKDVEAELGKKDSKYEDGPSTPIELLPGNNIISLQIPRNNINGWKMVGLNSLKMNVDSVIRLAFGRALIPFQVSVTWIRCGARPQTQLREKVTLTGVKELSNSLTVTLPQLCTGVAINRSGRGTPQYRAVLNSRADMIRRMQATPSMRETISSLFMEEEWIDIQAECSASNLVDCALENIRQDPRQFSILVGMLRNTVGMQTIVENLSRVV